MCLSTPAPTAPLQKALTQIPQAPEDRRVESPQRRVGISDALRVQGERHTTIGASGFSGVHTSTVKKEAVIDEETSEHHIQVDFTVAT